MAGEYEKVTVENNKTAWKCIQCSGIFPTRRAHSCVLHSVAQDDICDTPVNRFMAAEAAANAATSPMTPAPPVVAQPVQSTNPFDMTQIMDLLKHQQELSQRNLQMQMEQQMQREERMFERMLKSQERLIEKQNQAQNEFTKNVEERIKNQGEKDKESCGTYTKRTKCPKWDVYESLESFCDRI